MKTRGQAVPARGAGVGRRPEVTGVHVLTAPAASALEMYDFEVAAMVLSAKNWRAHCGPMVLFVNRRALDFVKKLGVVSLYDRLHLFHPGDFAGINRCYFWAAGKVVAAGKVSLPFAIVDLDCFVRRRPKFDLDAAVQPLNFERNYHCYQNCEAKYGGLLPGFSPNDWDATPVNVGLLGYYDSRLRDAYVSAAVDAMRRITAADHRYPGVNPFRDHIIFVEQKLLPMMAHQAALELSVFEDGFYDGYLATERLTHLWGIKGEYLRRPDWKLGFLEETLATYPDLAMGLTNPETIKVLTSPTLATRVFLPSGIWGTQGTKGWASVASDIAPARRMGMDCAPMPCGVTESRAQINFETQEVAAAFVEYGPSTAEIGKYATAVVQRRRLFNIRIPGDETDFRPGGLVYYRVRTRPVGGGLFDEGISHVFRLARPIADAGPWSCGVGADCRGDAFDTQNERFKSHHWPAAGKRGEDFHLAAGDIINARAEPGAGVGAWRSFRNDTEGVGREGEKGGDLPVFCCLGNHEQDTTPGAPSHAEARRARMPLGAFLDLPGQQTVAGDRKWRERYYYFTWGQVLFIGLDCETSQDPDGTIRPGRIGRTQRMWVEDTLTRLTAYKWKVIFAHRAVDEPSPPPVNHDNIAQSPGDRSWLLGLMMAHKVKLFVHGHYHGWRVRQRAGASDWHVCATWGSRTYASSGTWHGESFFCRFHFGRRWDGMKLRANPDWMTIEVVDPSVDTAKGGRVRHRTAIKA